MWIANIIIFRLLIITKIFKNIKKWFFFIYPSFFCPIRVINNMYKKLSQRMQTLFWSHYIFFILFKSLILLKSMLDKCQKTVDISNLHIIKICM